MKKINSFFRRLYHRMVLVTSDKTTSRIARQMFLKYMDESKFRYRISNDQTHMESGFDLSDGHYSNVHYAFEPDQKRILIQSYFLTIEADQIALAALLIAHLNTLMRSGSMKINFQRLQVYFENDVSYSSVVLEPQELDNFHHYMVWMPKEFLWCFNQVLDANEDPVVVMGEFIRKCGM
jgi:hypothetical protein